MFKRTAIFTALLLAVITICACADGTPVTEPDIPEVQTPKKEVSAAATISVIATRNFGRDLMFDEVLEASPDTSAMAALQKVAEVETAYGGGFVNAINGVRSGFTAGGKIKTDWFIYINGIQSNTGALDYIMQPGDVGHWDFHDWGFRQFTPATVGAFPEPFLHGYGGRIRPTLLVPSNSLREEAQKLQNSLAGRGVSDVSLRSAGELTAADRENSNLILIGTADNGLIAELNENWAKLGFFARFENGNLVVLDEKGEADTAFGAATGLIQATQNPWNPNGTGACENVAWMVTGTDEAGVRGAVDALKDPPPWQYALAVVIADGQIIRIPR